MSDVILTEQSAPASPGATKHAVYVDGTTKKLASKDSAGSVVDYMALVAPSTAGNVLTSNGSAWTSAAQDGWVATTWGGLTRTGATTFTTTTNVTNIIQKGDKLKFTDTTTKYLNVQSLSAYSAGVMTITTIANSDFALVGNPSAMSYSKIENPEGWPSRFNYQSTITSTTGTLTTVTQVLSYRVVSNVLILIRGAITIVNNGTGSVSISMTPPVDAAGAFREQFLCQVIVNATGAWKATGIAGFPTTSVLRITKIDNTYPAATGDAILLSGIYEY